MIKCYKIKFEKNNKNMKNNYLEYKCLEEFKDGDVIVPFDFIYDRKYEDKVFFAGCDMSFVVINYGERNILNPMSFEMMDIASKINTEISNIKMFIKIGKLHSAPIRIQSYFHIYKKQKYKSFYILKCPMLGLFGYRLDSVFPFMHIVNLGKYIYNGNKKK